MKTSDIVVIGSYNRDTTINVARFPAPGETLKALGTASSHGGKGSNQAVQAARLGVSVAMLACVGDDSAGTAAFAMWKNEQISTEMVSTVEGKPSGAAIILVEPEGENLIIVDGGANDCLRADKVYPHSGLIAATNLVIGQLETPQEATLAAFRIARKSATMTMLNAAPAPRNLSEELLALTDILVVNEGEARALGQAEEADQDAEEAARYLLPKVGRGVLLTLGAGGAMFLSRTGDRIVQQPAPVNVVDTTGAGDALIGAFSARLALKGTLAEALKWGVAAGTHACSAPGASPSFGTMADVLAVAAQIRQS